MTAYLVDTHPLIWATLEKHQRKLSSRVIKIFKNVDNAIDTLYVSAAVVWELGAFYRANKLTVNNHFFFKHWVQEEIFTHSNIIFLETNLEDVLLAGDYKVNRDPFDNLIVATAIRMDLPLITKDEDIILSGACKTVW